MATLFFFKESIQVSDVPIGELISLLEEIEIRAPIETGYRYSAIVNYDISDDSLKDIVERSGYIHSAGSLVFNERWNKISHIEVGRHIKNYFLRNKIHIDCLTFEKPKNPDKAKLWETLNKSIIEAQVRPDKAFLGRMSYKRMMRIISNEIKNHFISNTSIDLNKKENGALFIYKDFYKLLFSLCF